MVKKGLVLQPRVAEERVGEELSAGWRDWKAPLAQALPKAGWKERRPGAGGERETGKGKESPVKGFHLDAGFARKAFDAC